MTEKERIEANRQKNKPFMTAFEYFANYLVDGSQKKLCELIGVPSPRISEFKNGKKPVTDEAISALIRVSASKPGMQIFSHYLYGRSDIMLLSNVTDEEMVQARLRESNPDYDILEQRRKETEEKREKPVSSVDTSSAINAALAAYVELTNRLKQEMSDRLADKDTIIAEKQARIVTLEQTVADKDAIIRARDARILALERQIANINASDLSRYPFVIGAAEEQNNSNVSPYPTETSRKHQ